MTDVDDFLDGLPPATTADGHRCLCSHRRDWHRHGGADGGVHKGLRMLRFQGTPARQEHDDGRRGMRLPPAPPSGPPMTGTPRPGKSPEVRAAEIIAGALLEVAKSVDRLTEAVRNTTTEAAG